MKSALLHKSQAIYPSILEGFEKQKEEVEKVIEDL